MPRPLWKGAISFGMVSIPVKLYTATEEKDIRFHLLHEKDHARIKQQRFCPEDESVIAWNEVVRGFEVGPDQYVVLEDEDFEKVPVNTTHTIEIVQFVDLADIDPISYQRTYYLEPEDIGQKPFALLVRALKESGRVAIAKVTLRQKEHLCTLRIYDQVLALETMYYADEVRSPKDLEGPSESVQISDRELQMAKSLVDMLTGEFDYASYTDNYREALMEVIRKKAEGQAIVAPPPAVARVTDLMEALRASVEEARKRKETAPPVAQAAGQKNGAREKAEARPARSRKAS